MPCDSIGFTLDLFLDGDNAHPRVIKWLPGGPGKQCSKPSPKVVWQLRNTQMDMLIRCDDTYIRVYV